MPLSDKAVGYYWKTNQFAQLLGQQLGLVVTALFYSLPVKWHRHQYLSGNRVGSKVVA